MNKVEFWGRENYLEVLSKRVNAFKKGYRQNVAIIGDKDIGKTSIFLNFLKNFHDPHVLPLYLELRSELSREQFIRKFIGVFLYSFLQNSDIARNEDLEYLLSKANSFIPRTAKAIREALSSLKRKSRSESRDNTLIGLLSLCDILASETQKRCVIIFDEFHHLSSSGIRGVYKQFSKMLMLQKNVLYIISSSAKFTAKKILSCQLALLFGNFEVIHLEPFDLSSTEGYLKSRLTQTEIAPVLIDFLVHFTGGFPLYLKIIADSFAAQCKPINKEKLAQVIQDLMLESSGALHQRFSSYLGALANLKASFDYQQLLYLIAEGHNRIKDLASNLQISKTKLLSRLSLLLEYDIISKSGDFYIINDRLFGFWLRFVYREKSMALSFDTQDQKNNFRAMIDDKIKQFLADNQKPVILRTLELMHNFEDASIQFGSKRIRLDHFREIKTLHFPSSRIKEGLLGRSKQSLWIMAIKSDSLSEEDIIDFTTYCDKLRHTKPQRKIIITSANIDTNVRLKAMEEKILTWELDDLNFILDLYNKPRVVSCPQPQAERK